MSHSPISSQLILSRVPFIISPRNQSATYDHRVWKTGLPVRSAVLKPHAGELVVGWVTTSESSLLGSVVLQPCGLLLLSSHVPGAATCDSCKTQTLVPRKPRKFPSKSCVHYGIIASGNVVVKDGTEREKIDQRYENSILCFEMEAAGLMNNFPCHVVRGTSDYSDSHKND
ncbi:uncharacterized protein N7487_009575 [Penicillium crustosum]|uniref:uncharacterized protein n=1 Tax=Penicillium crustosum TaxID=36656 RepID=UPI002398D4A0|nr:uncharacterized protein N7487_009575 [Penicillium crustosum]KAJ5395272.1 hypothetical protein N7487_009575 [Penicillium crustosum]